MPASHEPLCRLCIKYQPLMHFSRRDDAHVAKRRPVPNPDLARHLNEAMEAHPELSRQAALSRKSGVSQSTISRMKRGEVDSQEGSWTAVFEALGISIGPRSESDSRDPGADAPSLPKGLREVPLISLVQAGAWGETVDPYQPGQGHRMVPCPVSCGRNTFALRVVGVSMEPRYHDGDTVFVDPDVSPTQGSDVVVRLENDNEATFKQLVFEGSRRWLKPRNPQFPGMEISTDAKIVGVVVGATWARAPGVTG